MVADSADDARSALFSVPTGLALDAANGIL
jgi:hypothetical protein